MTHANAPLTLAGRHRLVHRVITEGRPVAHVAVEAGIARPRPEVLPADRLTLVDRLGIFRRKGLDPNGENNRHTGPITASFPGHTIHLDVKKLGKIPDGGDWWAHGRDSAAGRASTRGPGQRVGDTYLHSAVDGFSRLAYTEAHDDERAATMIGFFARARAFFAAHGIARLIRVVTDNGADYRAKDFHRTVSAHASRHQRTRPYTP